MREIFHHASRLTHHAIMAHLQGQERADYVQDMFARIAGRYDTMNRLMTAGQDIKWRRYVIEQARLPQNGRLLDIATGTGDIALEGLRQQPGITAVGGDFTIEMVRQLNKASTSLLQRRFRIGYTRAARLIDAMEDLGIIGPPTGTSKAREVLPATAGESESKTVKEGE